ncbi:hypothetical protein EXS62_02295 [Candidatus Kaiserbacteria bacterium]|nr:hypothetical protein [Candidatus Kaiserbacteria bacterium]
MKLIAFYNAYAARTMALLAGAVALCLFLYGAFLLGAVAHAAGRTQAERQVRTTLAQVGTLENRYLALTKAISPERAATMGFVSPVAVSTVYADAHAGLTLR